MHLYKVVTTGEGQAAVTSLVQVEAQEKELAWNKQDIASDEGGEATWENLPVYDETTGEKIKYVVLEETVEGYTTTYKTPAGSEYVPEGTNPAKNTGLQVQLDGTQGAQEVKVKNALTPATSEVPVTKVWDDNSNVDNKRSAVTFRLTAKVWDPSQNNGAGGYIVEDPAKQADGTTPIADITLDGKANDPAGDDETTPATSKDEWTGKFTNLPETRNSKTVVYNVKEVTDLTDAGYKAPVVTGNMIDGYTVTNTKDRETVVVNVEKEWAKDLEAFRPDHVTVSLKADGAAAKYADGVDVTDVVITKDAAWKGGFINLPKNKDGKVGEAIVYTVEEAAVNGYVTTYSGTGTDGKAVTITDNVGTMKVTNTAQTGKITLTKTWDDEDNADNIRPESADDFANLLTLYANDTKVTEFGVAPNVKRTATVTADKPDEMTVTYENLPIYDGTGKKVNYRVEENVPTGYVITDSSLSTQLNETTAGAGYTGTMSLTDKHVHDTTTFTVTKVWDDNDNAYGNRPTVKQLKDVIKLYQDGTDVTAANANNLTVNISDDGNSYTLSWANLPKQGVYTAKETGTFDYYSDPEYTNTESAETDKAYNNGTITNRQLYRDLKVRKVWNDKILDLNTGKNIVPENRPDQISLTLTGDGAVKTGETEPYTVTKTVDVPKATATANADTFEYTFEKLPLYKADGKIMKYTLSEDEIPGYRTEYDQNNLIVINTYEVTKISGTKVWTDGDSKHNNPTDVKLELNYRKSDGKTGKADIPATVWGTNEADKNKFTITGLPVADKDGNTYEYWVSEKQISDYNAPDYGDGDTTHKTDGTPDGITNGGTITNSLADKRISITGNKVWSGGQDSEHDNTKLGLVLHRVSSKDGSTEETVIVDPSWKSKTGNSSYTYSGLPKYDKDGYEYTYWVTEGKVDDYKTSYTNDENKPAATDKVYDEGTINNTSTMNASVKLIKRWVDENDKDKKRPNVDTFKSGLKLMADGTDVTAANVSKLTVTDSGDNTYLIEWKELQSVNGDKAVNYTVTENVPDGYEVTYYDADGKAQAAATTGGSIVNTHKVKITVTYDPDNGEKETVTEINKGDKEPAQPEKDPAKDGYKFVGWKRMVDDDGNVTYTAQWEKIDKITITYDPDNDKDKPTSTEIERGADEPAQPEKDPTKDGYRFTGWQREVDPDTGDVTYKARWEKIPDTEKIDVAYDFDNGKDPEITTIARGENEPAQPQNPTKDGFTFGGWLRTVDDKGNVTYKANWIPNSEDPGKIKITYKFGNGASDRVSEITRGEDEPDQPANPERSGYVFGGWLRGKDKDGNVTYTANWVEIPKQKNTVTYIDPIADEIVVKSLDVDDPKANTDPADPDHTDNGLIFTKWKEVKINGNVIKVASYLTECSNPEEKITVTYRDLDGAEENVYQRTEIKKGGKEPKAPADPTKEGKTFDGWERTVDEKGNITYTAKWISDTYTVTFKDGNTGETITVVKNIKEHGRADVPKDEEIPEHEGYEFKGWRTPDGTIVTDLKVEDVTEDLIYTAVYEPIEKPDTHTVTYRNKVTGEDIKIDTGIEDGGSSKVPEPPAQEGYEFHGWLLEDGTVVKDLKEVKDITKDMLLIALYDEVTEESKTITRTIHYRYYTKDGEEVRKDVVQSVTFTRTKTVDAETGKVTYSDWTPASNKFDEVQSGEVKGFTPDRDKVDALDVDPNMEDVEEFVIYNKNEEPTTETTTEETTTTTTTAPPATTTTGKPAETQPPASGNRARSPETGDHNDTLKWAMIAVAAAAVGLTTAVTTRPKRKGKRR